MRDHLATLELPKILERLSEQASFPASAQAALDIRPQTDLQRVQNDMRRTEDAFMLICRFGRPRIASINDPGGALTRAAAGGTLSMRELLTVGEVLRNIRAMQEWRDRCERVETSIDHLFKNLHPVRELEDRIALSIVDDEHMSDDASDTLRDLRRSMRRMEQKIREQLDRIIRSPDTAKYLQEAIITMRDGRFVVPVKLEHRGDMKGLVHDTSSSGATVFVEPMAVVEANNDIRILQSQEQEEIERILRELSALCGESADDIQNGFRLLAIIDLLFAKASLALDMNAVVPMLNGEGRLNLIKARHPLIDKGKVVPIDLALGVDYTTVVVTGPNTGGKTVALKTIGLLTLMAMCGLMVPAADKTELSVFSHVLADIGDEQSIEQSLSTFSSHLTNIVDILKKADDRSLVLLDELGSGTDPVEGAALARAILDDLKSRGAIVAATTHYAELKVYALSEPGVENASCEFDVESLRPTYRLLVGIPGRSNAFLISGRLGLDEHIIARAQNLLDSGDKAFEEVVQNLETMRRQLEYERSEVERLNREAREQHGEAQRLREQMRERSQSADEEARERTSRIIAEVEHESRKLLDELQEIKKEQNAADFGGRVDAARAAYKSRMRSLHDKAGAPREKKAAKARNKRELKAGDVVMLLDIHKTGTVLEAPDRDGHVTVQVGMLKIKTTVDNAQLDDNAQKVQYSPGIRVTKQMTSNKDRDASGEIMLRHLTVEEALIELDRFLDDAVIAGLPSVRIVHGKGTGTLRSAVAQYLRRHKNVASFRLGTYGEGENGVTIAELK